MRQYVAKPGQECKSELIVGADRKIEPPLEVSSLDHQPVCIRIKTQFFLIPMEKQDETHFRRIFQWLEPHRRSTVEQSRKWLARPHTFPAFGCHTIECNWLVVETRETVPSMTRNHPEWGHSPIETNQQWLISHLITSKTKPLKSYQFSYSSSHVSIYITQNK